MNSTSTSRVFVLVHGTWGSPRTSSSPGGSAFCNWISDQIKEQTTFLRFEWSGHNSHRARFKAAERLGAFLNNVRSQYPDAQLFLICHSHGGNIALYALRDEELRGAVAGFIFLSTPFIVCTRRAFLASGSRYAGIEEGIIGYVVVQGVVSLIIHWAGFTSGWFWHVSLYSTTIMVILLLGFFWSIKDFEGQVHVGE